MDRRQGGFSLIEVLLSVAMLSLLAGLSLPVYAVYQTRADLHLTAQQVADAFRRAEIYARGVKGDSQWGVRIQANVATVYKGTSYAARDTAFDEDITYPGSVSASGLGEVNFAKLSAAPSTTGTATLSTATDSKTVSINAKGMVDY